MKRNLFITALFGLSLIVLFSSCNKNEITDLQDEVKSLKDSLSQYNNDYYVLLDSIIGIQNTIEAQDDVDLKAMKMSQIGTLFEAVARQPEAAADMVKATEMLYSDYTELLPLTDKAVYDRGVARGRAFGSLFSSIARQPAMAGQLDSIAEKFLGKYNPDYISDEMLDYTRLNALPYVNEAISRQPSIDSIYNALSVKYLDHSIY